jgi:rRNA maturation endonuclease Nob1
MIQAVEIDNNILVDPENGEVSKLREIVAKTQEDVRNLSPADKRILLKELEEHRAKCATGYRVVRKAQQQDVTRMAMRFEQEVSYRIMFRSAHSQQTWGRREILRCGARSRQCL